MGWGAYFRAPSRAVWTCPADLSWPNSPIAHEVERIQSGRWSRGSRILFLNECEDSGDPGCLESGTCAGYAGPWRIGIGDWGGSRARGDGLFSAGRFDLERSLVAVLV